MQFSTQVILVVALATKVLSAKCECEAGMGKCIQEIGKAASTSFKVKQAIFTINVSNNLKVSELNFSIKRIARVMLPRESHPGG